MACLCKANRGIVYTTLWIVKQGTHNGNEEQKDKNSNKYRRDDGMHPDPDSSDHLDASCHGY